MIEPDPAEAYGPPYQKIAAWYDAIYASRGRDPVAEVASMEGHWSGLATEGRRLRFLDVGCGTGSHLQSFLAHGDVEGLDSSSDMLRVARERHPDVQFHHADMCGFKLDARFDVVTCLFGASGYVQDQPSLCTALKAMAAHVAPGGVLLVEPPLFAEHFDPGQGSAGGRQRLEAPFRDGRVVRTADSRRVGAFLEIDFEWSHEASDGALIDRVRERHRLLLIDSREWVDAARSALPAGMEIAVDLDGPIGRGLLIGRFNPCGACDTG